MVLFLGVLVTPTVASVFRLNPFGDINEKRPLAAKPELSLWSREGWQQAPAVAQAWEKYFNDHFGFRKLLIGTSRLLAFHVFHISVNPAVVVGKSDGERRWLYFDASKTGFGVGLESIQGRRPYAPAELEAIANQLRQITARVRGQGAVLVIAVCPDKQSVYPQYLPLDQQPKPGAVSRLDQFWAMAASLPDVPLVDLRQPIRLAAATDQVFYPSDSHWNLRAGFLAYQAIEHAIAAQDPARAIPRLTTIQWVAGPPRVGDLTQLMGLPAIGGDRSLVPVESELQAAARKKRDRLLVIGDSFYTLIAPFMDRQFEQVKRHTVTRCVREAVLDAPLIEAEKPDVVILESLERCWTGS